MPMNRRIINHVLSAPRISNAVFTVCTLLSFFVLTGCSFGGTSSDHKIATLQGQHIENRPDMEKVCQGFTVDDKQLSDFIQFSALAEQDNLNSLYQKLPCFSSGRVEINNMQYQWIIRAGGVGEFFNDNHRFTKICGIQCCDKVQGVC